jgi:hypothetical protein
LAIKYEYIIARSRGLKRTTNVYRDLTRPTILQTTPTHINPSLHPLTSPVLLLSPIVAQQIMASPSPSHSPSLPNPAAALSVVGGTGTGTETPPSGTSTVPDEDPGVDLPMTMSASVILTNLPKDASQALEEVERLDGGKGMCIHYAVMVSLFV